MSSLDRAQTIPTSVGQFVVHHIHPDLYGGMERSGWHDLATPEKALFDTVYLLGAQHGRDVRLPEVTLPWSFDDQIVDGWIQRIPSKRLQTLTRTAVGRVLGGAERERPRLPASPTGPLAPGGFTVSEMSGVRSTHARRVRVSGLER